MSDSGEMYLSAGKELTESVLLRTAVVTDLTQVTRTTDVKLVIDTSRDQIVLAIRNAQQVAIARNVSHIVFGIDPATGAGLYQAQNLTYVETREQVQQQLVVLDASPAELATALMFVGASADQVRTQVARIEAPNDGTVGAELNGKSGTLSNETAGVVAGTLHEAGASAESIAFALGTAKAGQPFNGKLAAMGLMALVKRGALANSEVSPAVQRAEARNTAQIQAARAAQQREQAQRVGAGSM